MSRIYAYKTTCLLNNKFYYGVHTEHRKSDGYIGCGIVSQGTADALKRSGVRSYFLDSVLKYGYKNFKKEVIKEFENVEDAYRWEAEHVTESLLKDNNCLNTRLGGFGGIVPSLLKKTVIIDCETKKKIHFESQSEAARFLGLKNISGKVRFKNCRYVRDGFQEPISLKTIDGLIHKFEDIYYASRKINIPVNRIKEVLRGERNSSNGYFSEDFDFSKPNWRGAKSFKNKNHEQNRKKVEAQRAWRFH